MTATKFNVPTREEVSTNNQALFDTLQKGLGFIPNTYATIALSSTALENYMTFTNAKTSLSKKEKEVINLVVSQVNSCEYCLAAHTAIGKLNGFNEEQIIEIRKGTITFDNRFDALAKFAKEIAINKGHINNVTLENLLDQGFSKENVMDIILAVADISITNYVNNITKVPIDFPPASQLD